MAEIYRPTQIERPVAIKALVGSHNYNLNDETSDRDYKYFVYPSFNDLYDAKYYSLPSQVTEELDFDVHDIRKLSQLFWKSNINFLEVLFSKELELVFPPLLEYGGQVQLNHLWNKLFNMRNEIALMNLPYLYHACKGMHFNKMQYLTKGTKGTMHLVKKYGYDTKQALHAYRVLDFVERLAHNGYNFQDAMTYKNEGFAERDGLLRIKYGYFTHDEFLGVIKYKYAKFEALQPQFDALKPNDDLHEHVKQLIRDIVKTSLC